MTDQPMPALRRRFLDDMRIKGLLPKTQTMHLRAMREFTRFLGHSPDTATPEELRAFQLDMKERGVGAPTFNNRLTGDPPALVQSFDSTETDAALLQIPLLGLPLDRDLLAATVERVEADLRDGDLVRRYRGEDGLEGEEGAFLITSFWLVDALLVLGRAEDARALFQSLLGRANDVGLYAEEVDPASGAFLGNVPQAFTHLALIASASLLDLHDRAGPGALRGDHAARGRRLVGRTEGPLALLHAFLRHCRVRMLGSRRSVLALDCGSQPRSRRTRGASSSQ